MVIALNPGTGNADVPVVSHLMVTDVTTVSFSVIWASSEASTADIEVYEDADGTIAVADAIITPHPVNDPINASSIVEAAENSGVMKVMVTGLQADTTYFFKTITTSISTDDITEEPAAAPFSAVTTELATVRTYLDGTDVLPFSNDVIIEPCYLEDGTTPADGSLLIATVAGGHHPITAFIGDGVDSPYALIDLNNMFSRETFENLDLHNGENLTLLNFRGINGNSVVTHEVPVDNSLAEIKDGDFLLKAGWNMLSFQLNPTDPDLLTVLAPIEDSFDAIWAYDNLSDHWYRYDKNNPFPWLNDLTDMGTNIGYWIVMNQEGSLKVNGAITSGPIQLTSGWNLVGSKFIETVPLLEAVDPIYENFLSIWHYNTQSGNWLRYDVNNPFPWLNDLQNIEPGKAYWIVVNQDCLW
jgi:hypothetical protein